MSDIEQKVKQIVAEQLSVDVGSIDSDSNFIDDLGADSLDTVELVMALEQEFDASISDEDAKNITTVASVVKYITKKS